MSASPIGRPLRDVGDVFVVTLVTLAPFSVSPSWQHPCEGSNALDLTFRVPPCAVRRTRPAGPSYHPRATRTFIPIGNLPLKQATTRRIAGPKTRHQMGSASLVKVAPTSLRSKRASHRLTGSAICSRPYREKGGQRLCCIVRSKARRACFAFFS